MKMCDEQIRISSTGSSVWVSHNTSNINNSTSKFINRLSNPNILENPDMSTVEPKLKLKRPLMPPLNATGDAKGMRYRKISEIAIKIGG